MQKIYNNPAELEKLAKEKFSIPPFLMMENAARAMANFILKKNPKQVLIVCGKGNNGGDGYAVARMLYGLCNISVLCIEPPTAEEAHTQYEICKKLGIEILTSLPSEITADIILDCIYGIGFHGELKSEIKILLDTLNSVNCTKIACDVPSALYFNADYTITMGEQKTALYSDEAKKVCGQIIVADLGIPRSCFEACSSSNAFLIEETDLILPVRTNKSAHKGTYGHTAVFAGEKSGAGIIAATAAMKFGSGLTTLVKTENSNLEQFKISPELMLSSNIPSKASCVVLGPGFGNIDTKGTDLFMQWFKTTKNSNVVLDADMFSWDGLEMLLEELNKVENAKIVLTPHLSELSRFVKNIDVKTLANSVEEKIKLGVKLNRLYPKTAVVIKSANTFIALDEQIYVCSDGTQSLAKGGSGDVLAGMTGALLAQGYSLHNAVITAVEAHALASKKIGSTAFDLTPEKLISSISCI